jgi:hypothetical protein
MLSTTTFHYRVNDDGTFNSNRMCCYRTVASRMGDSQLAEFEHNHIWRIVSYGPIGPETVFGLGFRIRAYDT